MADRPFRVAMLTSVHPPLDTRIFHREAKAARDMGAEVFVIAPGAPTRPVDGIAFRSLPAWGGRAGRPFRWPSLFIHALRLRADVYHLHDPELLPWGLLLKWVTRRAVVYDSHEYLAEGILAKHWIPERLRDPVARFAGWFEKRASARLSAVVTVTEDMGDRFRPFQPNVAVVRNLPDARPDLEVGDEREPVVIYAGLMNAARGLDILYDTARLVRERVPSARFEILGTVEWHGIDPAVRDLRPEDWRAVGVEFLGQVPFEQVAPRLARAAVGWLPRSPHDLNNLLAWPNKLVEYMAAGLPIVASDLPTQARVIAEAGCGVAVEALSPRAHADAIRYLLEHEQEARYRGRAGLEASRTRFTWGMEAQKLQSLYRRISRKAPQFVDPIE